MKLLGEKIYLTQFHQSDIDEIYLGWLNNQNLMQYSNQRFKRHDLNSASNYLNSFNGSENVFLAIFDKSSNQKIGTLTAYIYPVHGVADIGIMVGNEKYSGQGMGLDAWQTFINWLFFEKKIRKIIAGTLVSNIRMVNIMKKSGMHYESTWKKHEYFNGDYVDLDYYAKFNTSV